MSHYFESVSAIEKAGNYQFFASPPESIPFQDRILGNHPMIESLLKDNIRERFPSTQYLEFIPKNGFEFDVVKTEWSGEENGLLVLDGSYSAFYSTLNNQDGTKTVAVRIWDCAAPEFQSGKPHRSERNGKLEVLLSESIKPKGAKRFKPHWRGQISLSGDKRGELVTAGVDYLNQFIKDEQLSLWRKIL